MSNSREEGSRDPYAVWRNGNYRLYAASWFLLSFAKQIETLAAGVFVYELTKDALSLGWIGLAQALPVMLLAIPGGQMADRVDRRRVMMTMLVLSTLVAFGLAVVVSQHEVRVSWMYMLLFGGAISQALGSPSRAALLPQLVGAEIFSNAVAWNSTAFHIATMSGPAVGGLVLSIADNTSTAFFLVAFCRVLSLAAISMVRVGQRDRSEERVSWQSLAAGIRFVWHTELILATITLDLFAVLLGGATYLLPLFARDILLVGSLGLGMLRSAEAVGAVTMSVLLAHMRPMQQAGRTMLWAVAGVGVATIVFGLSQWFWLSLAMMFLIGALDNISVVVRHTLVQMLTPDRMRGRVSAINNIFIVASNDLGGMESGVTARLFGPVASVVAGGVGAIVVVLATARKWPGILRIGSLRDIRPVGALAASEQVEEEIAARG